MEKRRLHQIGKESAQQGDNKVMNETLVKMLILEEDGKQIEQEQEEIPDEHIHKSFDEKKKKLAKRRKIKA